MKAICYLLMIGLLAGTLPAQDVKSDRSNNFGPEARAAFLRWQKAREKSDQAYIAELRRCLNNSTRKGKLEEAVAIKAEISKLSRQLAENRRVSVADFLAGTVWVNADNGASITLEAGGKGRRESGGRGSDISYKIISEGKFSIQWTGGTRAECVLAIDRKSFRGGETKWILKP